MLSKRIIPCLDILNGRTVKGVNFVGLRDAGDPVELARRYSDEGADELVFLDISASHEKRKTLIPMVERVAREVNIPFTVGGGVGSIEDAEALLHAGADKISVNSAAIKRPELLKELSDTLGNQCVVIAIDAAYQNGIWKVFLNGGRIETDLELFSWAQQAVELGAGEILFTSMNQDGTKQGFHLDALQQLAESVKVPIIASGGAGKIEHFINLFKQTDINAALAASIFHFGEVAIDTLKKAIQSEGIQVRTL
jgi:cyclase